MIKLSKSSISTDEINAVTNVLKKEYLGMGTEVQQFEKNLENFFGRETVCVVNGTAALHLSLQAIGLKENDEVICPSITYLSSFQAISATGAKVIPCDVFKDTLTIDYFDLISKINSNTKAIMIVHYAGGICNVDEIYKIAQKNDLRVIEDAAHAFGSKLNGKVIGSFGDIVCFSFDGIKNITSGEGGCITTSDQTIINKIKNARLLGVVNDTEQRFKGKRSWDFNVVEQGWRYHMSNIMAAIGIEQLKKFHLFEKKRKYLANYYKKILSQSDYIKLLDIDYKHCVPHIFVVLILKEYDRDSLRKKLLSLGIETGVHYYPNHKLSYYSSLNYDLPVTESIYKNILTLPLHHDLSIDNLDYVCKHLLNELDVNEG